ncbi:4-vinyl reductase [Achromobacter spanius]|uniref:4-vinyl reductase n=1 Tax=Achromobacter spanius TaxID=217203 RepID=UPI00320948BC
MGKLQERLKWDQDAGAILDADRRYVMLRADVLMGLFARLPPGQRGQALDSLQTSVRTNGGASARAYQAGGAADAAGLLRVMAESAADLGWGVWRFGNDAAGALTLAVDSSPFAVAAATRDSPVCHAITGMLEAVSALVTGESRSYREVRCASMGAPCCEFQAKNE